MEFCDKKIARSDSYRPIGETDSEFAFCLLLERLAPLWRGTEGPPPLRDQLEAVAEVAEGVRAFGPANFLYSDGDVLFAHTNKRHWNEGGGTLSEAQPLSLSVARRSDLLVKWHELGHVNEQGGETVILRKHADERRTTIMSQKRSHQPLAIQNRVALCMALALGIAGTAPAEAKTVAVDAAVLEKLQQIIKQQQSQLEKQSKQLETQSKTLESLQTQVESLQKTTAETATMATQAQSAATQAQSTAQQAKEVVVAKAPANDGSVVTSGQEKIKLAISGQINRALNVANDGTSTKYYNVDNSASNSRIRFVGTGKVNEDLTIGSQIELAIGPNQSSKVSQDDEDSGDFFDERKVEAWLDSKTYGRLTIGKGSTASDNSAEQDLSQTDVVAYASIADIAGGLQFRDKDNKNLSGTTVADAFKDFDGLGRQNRIQYDTPRFYGFGLGTSASADQKYDVALTWGGKGHGFKVVSAVAAAQPNDDDINYQVDGSVSVLHEKTGLNLTLSSGMKDSDEGGNPNNIYLKGGWLTDIFEIGKTAFSADYTRSVNLPTRNDHGYSLGLAAVQKFEEFGSELYAQFRLYELDRDDAPSVKKIYVGTAGTRVKF